jgi:hypothetical protein
MTRMIGTGVGIGVGIGVENGHGTPMHLPVCGCLMHIPKSGQRSGCSISVCGSKSVCASTTIQKVSAKTVHTAKANDLVNRLKAEMLFMVRDLRNFLQRISQ